MTTQRVEKDLRDDQAWTRGEDVKMARMKLRTSARNINQVVARDAGISKTLEEVRSRQRTHAYKDALKWARANPVVEDLGEGVTG